jgi:hypothetical protein|nr:hypothetical protein [uncultured Schaedlerella sp.]
MEGKRRILIKVIFSDLKDCLETHNNAGIKSENYTKAKDLFFSGTEYDFQKLNRAFAQLGVTQEQVRLIMRNELEDAEVKRNEINEMAAWLRAERNIHRFQDL